MVGEGVRSDISGGRGVSEAAICIQGQRAMAGQSVEDRGQRVCGQVDVIGQDTGSGHGQSGADLVE